MCKSLSLLWPKNIDEKKKTGWQAAACKDSERSSKMYLGISAWGRGCTFLGGGLGGGVLITSRIHTMIIIEEWVQMNF